jgi:hypothetical protein
MNFEITPRRRRDGFTLNSETLFFPLWYTTLNGAISYARFLGRDRGCDIRICSPTGALLEEIKVDGNWAVAKSVSRFRPDNKRGKYRSSILNKPL